MGRVCYVLRCPDQTAHCSGRESDREEEGGGVEMGRRGNSKRETVAEEVRERARVVVIVAVRSFVLFLLNVLRY